jgi:hypothetical protein
MASITCGKCKATHTSPAEVRDCYGLAARAAARAAQPSPLWGWNDRQSAPVAAPATSVVSASPSFYAQVAPATPRQVAFIRRLAGERQVPFVGSTQDEARLVARYEDALGGKDVSKAEASDVIGWLQGLPVATAVRPVQPTAPVALPVIPEGHYAVPSRTGSNDLDFFRVDRPTEGRWAGRTFVKRVIGGRPDQAVRQGEARLALEAIAAEGVAQAAVAYGRAIGRCYRCNRHLTDETSRNLGIGPDCRSK